MNSRTTAVLSACICLASLILLPAHAAERSTSYTNHSDQKIYVEEVLCDGKNFPFTCGILGPGSFAKFGSIFPKQIPDEFVIGFREDYGRESLKIRQKVDGRGLRQRIKTARRGANLTLHFVFNTQAQFEVKLEERLPGEERYDGKLWPDENVPEYGKYQKLVSAAYSRNAQGVHTAIAEGARDFWPNDPRGMTPLEWTVRWRQKSEFDLLIGRLPKEYSRHTFANCVRLAVKNGDLDILKRLLAEPISRRASKWALQETFYAACGSPRSLESIPMLLAAFPVDVNFQVRDFGHTMLFLAAENGDVRLVEWLLANGADKDAKLENGDRAINRARNTAVRELLAR